jgi:uncharacterized protein (DUF1786 family)
MVFTLAGIIDNGEIIALMEHHTYQMSPVKLDDFLEQLCNGTLGFNEIYDDGGHGCYIRKSPGIDRIGSILVTGPRRDIMRGSKLDLHFAAPYGDMMLTGCFGLVDGYLHYVSKSK